MPHLDSKYVSWDELLRETDSGLFEDTEYITMDSLNEVMRDLESEIMPYLDSKYAWEEDLFNLIKWEDWSEDTKYICMDSFEDFKKATHICMDSFKNFKKAVSSNETLD